MQQWRVLKKKGIQKPDPRKQCITDLSTFMEELQDKDHELVLSLHANEDTIEASSFKQFIEEEDLINMYKHLHSNLHPATYIQGQKMLDYVFITPGLIPALVAAGYLPFHMGIFLDHRTLFVDFDPEVLFLGDLFSSIEPATKN
eukprot:5831878-Ditylum_brightwellii.AAC.1